MIFRDMLNDAKLGSSSEPILIDAGTEVVKTVVKWLKNEEVTERIDKAQVDGLLVIWETYELVTVRHRLIAALSAPPGMLRPWETFITAAALDSVDLAKLAIGRFNRDPFSFELKNIPSKTHLQQLGPRYTMALARACIEGQRWCDRGEGVRDRRVIEFRLEEGR
jgi:hypothetical protein